MEFDGLFHDDRVDPSSVISAKGGFGWIGNPQHETAKFTVYLESNQTVKHIIIDWRIRPLVY